MSRASFPQACAAVRRPACQRCRIGVSIPGVPSVGDDGRLEFFGVDALRGAVIGDIPAMGAPTTEPVGQRRGQHQDRPQRGEQQKTPHACHYGDRSTGHRSERSGQQGDGSTAPFWRRPQRRRQLMVEGGSDPCGPGDGNPAAAVRGQQERRLAVEAGAQHAGAQPDQLARRHGERGTDPWGAAHPDTVHRIQIRDHQPLVRPAHAGMATGELQIVQRQVTGRTATHFHRLRFQRNPSTGVRTCHARKVDRPDGPNCVLRAGGQHTSGQQRWSAQNPRGFDRPYAQMQGGITGQPSQPDHLCKHHSQLYRMPQLDQQID